MGPRVSSRKAVEDIESFLKKSSKKTYWRDRQSEAWEFYCPLCKAQRKIPYRPRPGGVKHFAQVGSATLFLALLTWEWLTWKGILYFFPLWAIFEIIYRTRVRSALGCTDCGFDPYLYLVDVKRARKEVEDYWRKKFAEKGIEYPQPGAAGKVSPAPSKQTGALDPKGQKEPPSRFPA